VGHASASIRETIAPTIVLWRATDHTSATGKPYTPPPGRIDPSVDTKTTVREQGNRLGATTYFNLLATLMKNNPPALADGVPVVKMASLGIVSGRPIEQAPKEALPRIMGHLKTARQHVKGWTFTTNGGDYGKDYLQRALATAVGLGCNLPQDAVYPPIMVDAAGQRLTGTSKYVMRFPAGELPPVNGFWSLTMYRPPAPQLTVTKRRAARFGRK
jgi:hypothetical protein